MAVTQYIGSRYVPVFADPIEWSSSNTYEPLTIVIHEGNSYTSKQAVPKDIAIDNEAFWALTGNYNAQIELYRRETAAAKATADDAQAVAEDAQADATAAQTDIDTLLPKVDFSADNTVKKYVDDSVEAVQTDIDTLLPKSDFSAENNVKDYIDTSVSETVEKISALETHVKTFSLCAQSYLGRYAKDTAHGVQGATMIDNAVGLFAMPTSANTDNDVLVARIDVKTGDVIAESTCQFGHCNSMCFNSDNNKLYVVPNQIYSNGVAVKTDQMYICNSSTLAVEQVITMPKIGLNATYDFVSSKMYVTCETTVNDAYAVELYSFDYENETFESIGIIPHNPKYISFANGRSVGTDGAQGCEVYDGNAYFLIGGHINSLIEFDLTTLAPTGLIDIDPNCFIYTISEAEAACFTPSGNIIMSSLARNAANQVVNLISALHYNGMTFDSFDAYAPRNTYLQYVDCDGTIPLNDNIYQTGSEANRFSSLGEAISLSVMQGVPVRIYNTCKFVDIPRTDFSPNVLRFVAGNDPATIEFAQSFYPHAPIYFDGTSATRRLTLKSGYTDVHAILFTSYKMIACRYVEFDCSNMNNYIFRFNGFAAIDSCTAINTESMYTTIIDAQNRGNGFVYNSTGVTLHDPAPLQV